MDVHGNDNTPEWGYCTADGCHEEAFPIWLSGDSPDDADLLLCPLHIGRTIARLQAENAQLQARVRALETSRDWWRDRAHTLLDQLRTAKDVLAIAQLQAPAPAEVMAMILQAQLGGWEAACAAQIAAIRRTLPYLEACHDSQADMLIEDLRIAIETNVGETLLARLADLSRQIGEQNTTIGYQDALLATTRSTLDAAYHALMSYAHGNSAHDLAEEVAATVLATMEKVSK